MAHKDLGFKLLKQVEERLSDLAFPEMPAKMERRTLFTILAPQSPTAVKKSPPKKKALEPPLKPNPEPSH